MLRTIPARRRTVIGALAAATTTVAALVLTAPGASAAPAPGPYRLVNAGSGLCLDVPGGATSDGVQLVQERCDGAAGQTFTLVSAGGGFQIRALHSGKCLGVRDASTSAGKAIQQETCTGASSQIWMFTESGANYRIANANGGKCMNIKDNSTAISAPVQTNSCDSVATKQWTLSPVGGTPTDSPPTNPPQADPPAGLVGWATQGGGTTGGGNAAPVTVSSASALAAAIGGTNAAVVRVSGTISCSGMLQVGSNKTIVGTAGATIAGCGLNVSRASNVIIRNLTFRNWDDDAINVQYSTRVWIDHNTLSNGSDGAIDIKRASDYVTVSWNRIYNHGKVMLLGHSDSNGSEDRGRLRVTYHHNWFDGTNSRHPRVRFGNPVHVFNNYYDGVTDYGVASTEEAGVLVEGNYFENTSDPFHRGEGSSDPGSLVARNNYFVNSGSGDAGGSVAPIPYAYTLENPANVKASVMNGAGAGKINP